MTYSEKHPTPGERQVLDWIRLLCVTTVFSLELIEGNRDIFRFALESLQEPEPLDIGIVGGTRADRPWLSQVSEIRKLPVQLG